MEQSLLKVLVLLSASPLGVNAYLIANQIKAPALISGESIGQVASQTLSNIRATSDATNLPIIRPLAGSNKEDIIHLAEKIYQKNLNQQYQMRQKNKVKELKFME